MKCFFENQVRYNESNTDWRVKHGEKDLLANYAASKQNMCITNDTISDGLFQEYGVNRGLRDVNGKVY